MKLKDDFFKIKDIRQAATGLDYTLALNPEHPIYRAHFPGNPITPGVCIIQIVKELLEGQLKCELLLKKVNNAKFLNVINPLENRKVVFAVSISSTGDDAHKVSVVVSGENQQFAKLALVFVKK